MRKYETVVISDPDLQDQTRAELFDKIRNIIARENGIFLKLDDWGSKKMAYEIKKKLRGHYACLTYGGTGDLVKELERNLRLADDVMKYMTILISDAVTAESLAQELKDAEEAEAAAAAADASQAADTPKDTDTEADAGTQVNESAPDGPGTETAPETAETVTHDKN